MNVPDLIEPLEGWRVWTVRLRPPWPTTLDPTLRLTSLYHDQTWEPTSPVRAHCLRARHPWSPKPWLPAHPAPLDGCGCGIHATHRLTDAAEYLPDRLRRFRPEPVPSQPVTRMVFGRVRLWGTVVEYERGYRGQYGQVSALWVPTSFGLHGLDARDAHHLLTEAYGVPVELVRRASDVEVAA